MMLTGYGACDVNYMLRETNPFSSLQNGYLDRLMVKFRVLHKLYYERFYEQFHTGDAVDTSGP